MWLPVSNAPLGYGGTMNKRLFVLLLLLVFLRTQAFASWYYASSGGGTSYLPFTFSENNVSWDDTSGAENCAMTADGHWCDQFTTVKYAGSYSLALRGGSTFVSKNIGYGDCPP